MLSNLSRLLSRNGYQRTATGGGNYSWTKSVPGGTITFDDADTLGDNAHPGAMVQVGCFGCCCYRMAAARSHRYGGEKMPTFGADRCDGVGSVERARTLDSLWDRLEDDGMLGSPWEEGVDPEFPSAEAWQIEHAEGIARIAADVLGIVGRGFAGRDLPSRDDAIDRASMLITLLRCMVDGENSVDLGLGCDIVAADRDLAERLLTWVGEKNCEVLANIRP